MDFIANGLLPIKYSEMFREGAERNVLIYGLIGAGKSCVCNKTLG